MSRLSERPPSPLVIKFGGTSVGGGAEFARAARIAVDAARQRPLAVVVSAMSGVTNTLLAVAKTTAIRKPGGATREGAVAELHRTLAERHLRAARESVSAERLPAVEARVLELLDELVSVIERPFEKVKARRDEIAVFGERLSSVILAGAIHAHDIPAEAVAEHPIATDGHFGEAEVDPAVTRERCTRLVAPLLDEGMVAVVPGFAGRSPSGAVTTLGRGGSDLSATVIGRALDSDEVWIMTDVDGVLDADPRLVSDAALLPRLSYREAGTFAGLGAKVLHPRTMEPAEEAGIEVRVRNSFSPERPGTRVSSFEEGPGVRCLALRRKVAFEIPCTDGRERKAAMVVGIGSPDGEDLARGLKCLRRAGISAFHSGIAPAGLVYVVAAEDGEEALRALHGTLLSGAGLEVVA